MVTIDGGFAARPERFLREPVRAGQPFFAWFTSTRMHIYPHLKPESRLLADAISSEFDIFGSGMMEHDGHVGRLLKLLDELKVADDTIVIYTSDNGPMSAWWPDGGTGPFRGQKATTWEGGVRVPTLLRWPGHVAAGSVSNCVQAHDDLFTALAAVAVVRRDQAQPSSRRRGFGGQIGESAGYHSRVAVGPGGEVLGGFRVMHDDDLGDVM